MKDERWVYDIELSKEDILDFKEPETKEDEVVKKQRAEPTQLWWEIDIKLNKEYLKQVRLDESGLLNDFKKTIIHYLKYLIIVIALQTMGTFIIGGFSATLGLLGIGAMGWRTIQVTTTLLLSQYGLLMIPIRYAYLRGLKDVLKGREIESILVNYKNIKEFKKYIGIESILLALIYSVGIVRLFGSNVINITLSSFIIVTLMVISHIMILVRIDNPGETGTEIKNKTVKILEGNKELIGLMWFLMGVLNSLGVMYIVYIPDIIITVIYLRTKTAQRGDKDVNGDNGINRKSL